MNIILCSIGALQNPKESARITLLMMARELIQQGNKVVITARHRKSMPGKETIDGFTIYRYKSLVYLPFTIKKIQRQEGWKADIIHGFSAAPLFVVPLFFSKLFSLQAKIILSLKSYSRDKWGMWGSSLTWLANKITVPTSIHAQTWKIKNYEIVHSPIDAAKFKPLDKNKLKKERGFENKKIILHYGAVSENKGANNLIRAIPSIIKQYPNALFLFLPRYQKIEQQLQLVKEYGVEKYARFITEDVKIEDYVNLADAIALPYINLLGTEGNPSCLLEAMACKTPVVTTDLPELREIADGCVLMAKPNDIESLAGKIALVIKNTSKEMIEKAYQKSQEFNSGKISKKFMSIYEEVISGFAE